MRSKVHGLISLGLAMAAVVVAFVVLFRTSPRLGWIYLALNVIAMPVVLYAFCSKCSYRADCSHVLPGKAAGIFKNRKPGPYTPIELSLTGMAMLVLIGFPQTWLWPHTVAMIAFWVLMAVAVLDIRAKVCKVCDNKHCPGNGRFKS